MSLANLKQSLFTVVKISLSALAIWLISQKIAWQTLINVMQRMDSMTLLLAFAIYNLSQLLGAVRSRQYLQQVGIDIDPITNSCLYYLGMFYNLFLPGGIGGDGYKVYFLQQYFSGKTWRIIQALLLDRLNGFMGLILLAVYALHGMVLPFGWQIPGMMLLGLAILSMCVFTLMQAWVLGHNTRMLGITLLLSIAIQCMQALAALLIIRSLGDLGHTNIYIVIFLLSSIAVQIPLSMGGVGAREVTVVYLLNLWHIEPSIGLAMAMLYFLIQSLSNALGVLFFDLKLPPSQQAQACA